VLARVEVADVEGDEFAAAKPAHEAR
jgi:hypothetical protein